MTSPRSVAWIHVGSTRFDLHARSAARDEGRAVRFAGTMDALHWLHRAAVDPAARAALRRFALQEAGAPPLSSRDDEEVLRDLAVRLAAGRVTLVERAPAALTTFPGDAATDTSEASAPQSAPSDARRPAAPRTWITLELVGEDDGPIPGERYRIALPDGTTREGRLDGQGLARLTDIEPGQCVVTFPDLDEEAWVPLGSTRVP